MDTSRKRILLAWAIAIGGIVLLSWVSGLLDARGISFWPITLSLFFSWLVAIILTTWILAIIAGFILRKLFWGVGRRLALSYLLIGLLPFILFAVLLAFAGYIGAGVLSQNSFRAHRQATLTSLDKANLEYALTGVEPGDGLESLEIYDSRQGSDDDLPSWLREGTFIGLAYREFENGETGEAVFVSARTYQLGETIRTVTLVQPADLSWQDEIEVKRRMKIWRSLATRPSPDSVNVEPGQSSGYDEGRVRDMIMSVLRVEGVMWWDITTPLVGWTTGEPTEHLLFLVILNPWANLFDYYFGSPEYVDAILGIIAVIGLLLLFIYMMASLLAGGMIYSITRAVNRIDRGTRAVEKGDFSYRIGMKRRDQLGDVAQSFDRMTESISDLLNRVTEQERLQSEIDIAASIQRNLLPKDGPRFRGVSFSAHFEPTAAIGGDYYDVFNLDETRLAVAIGDVSGHGLSTGLVMAMVKAAMTTLVEEGASEAALFKRLNELVYRSTEKRAFMTLGFTIFDLEKRTIRHTNAGHLYPYILRAGEEPFSIEAPSLPLGVKQDIDPHTVEVPLLERDTIVYLSDGIIEAQDRRGDPYGFDALESILGDLSDDSAATIQERILEAVEGHTGGVAAIDDSTIMILRFESFVDTQISDVVASEQLDLVGQK